MQSKQQSDEAAKSSQCPQRKMKLWKSNKDVISNSSTLSELNSMNKKGLLPLHSNQDIEQVCAFTGALDILTCYAPDVITLVHGSAGCGLSYSASRAWPGCSAKHRPKIYTTGMNQNHVVFGGLSLLREALLKIDDQEEGQLIVVLTNCCSYITGENVSDMVSECSEIMKKDAVSLEVSGCSGSGFRRGADAAYDLLFGYVANLAPQPFATSSQRPSINLFTRRVSGRPADLEDIKEMGRLLDMIGVDINRAFHLGCSLDDLLSAPGADANATLCFTFGRGPLESLYKYFKQPFAPMTYPLGLEATKVWIGQVAELLGIENTFDVQPEVVQAAEKIDVLRKKVAGRDAYVWQPGEKGLATAVFAAELGMKVVLFGMSYYLEEQLRPTVELLLKRGYDMELVLAGEYEVLIRAREIPLESRPLIFMPKKFLKGRCPGVTFNMFTDTLMGLAGIDTLVTQVERALETAEKQDYRLFDKYLVNLPQAAGWKVDGDIISGL